MEFEIVGDSDIGMKRTASGKKKSNASGTSTKPAGNGRSPRRRGSRFAVCIDNSTHPASLELHKIYRVIADEKAAKDGDLRVVDESGEDYLYPSDWFVPIELPRKASNSVLRSRLG